MPTKMIDNFEKERYAPEMFDFRYEHSQDIAGIRKVHEAAFETRAEADLVDALRDIKADIISLVAVRDVRIVGHILFSPVTLDVEGRTVTLLGLAPMAVLTQYQRKGIGSKLVEKGLAEGRAKSYPAVVVLGHPGYYPRFGFVPSVNYGITSEYDVPPDVFMIKELQPGVLTGISGIAKYHAVFADL
jgi:putative acetyltransferase